MDVHPTSCDVSDALQGLGVLYGGFIPGPTLRSPQYDESIKIVGRAYTVQYISVSASAGVTPNEAGHYVRGHLSYTLSVGD